jgi:hypothetical protein
MTTLTASEIAKIVEATGIEPDDRDMLAKELAEAHAVYMQLVDREKREPKRPTLKAIRKAFEKLTKMVKGNPIAEQTIEETVDLDKLCQKLCDLEQKNKLSRRYSLKDALAGSLLPQVFEDRFCQEATVTRGGPFVLFATAVAEAFHLNHGPEAIIKALSRFKRDDTSIKLSNVACYIIDDESSE